jgi:hypothetical protein
MPATICRFIRVNGQRCGSPALSGKPFCYFHHRDVDRHRTIFGKTPLDLSRIPAQHLEAAKTDTLIARYYGLLPDTSPVRLELPPLEDRASVQVALSMIISALAQERIDPKRANSLLYGLQVASANIRSIPAEHSAGVTETVLDPDLQLDIAPDSDPERDPISQAIFDAIIDRQENTRDEDDEDEDDDEDDDDDEDWD